MENKTQNESRWFLIKHTPKTKKCGAIFTINSKTFVESYQTEQQQLKCPNCQAIIIEHDKGKQYSNDTPQTQISGLNSFIGFLSKYNQIKDVLKESTIREIQPKELEAIKNLGYKTLDK